MIYIIGAFLIVLATAGTTTFTDRGYKSIPLISGIVIFAVWTIGMMVTIVSAGTVAIATWFGSVQTTVIPEGFQFINPMTSTTSFSTRRDTVDFSNNKEKGSRENPINGPAILALSSDRNPLTIEASFPYSINATLAWKLFQRVAQSDGAVEAKLLETNARKIVAEVFARHGWAEATLQNRSSIETELQAAFVAAVISDLAAYGFSEAEARTALTIGKPQLREVKPDDKVLSAIADRLASEEQLKRQKVLTEIAAQEAERRANEGTGVAKLFEQLPKDFKPEQIRDVLGALADKERADALMKAVELGRVTIIAIPSTSPVALPLK